MNTADTPPSPMPAPDAPPPAPPAVADGEERTPPPRRRRGRRLLAWTLAPLFALLGLAIGGLGFLLHTESGLQWLYRQAQTWLPGQLQAERLAGRLTGPLELRDFRYQQPGGLDLAIGRLDLDWQPRDLFTGLLRITRLDGEGIQARLPPGEPTPAAPPAVAPTPFAGLSLPLAVHLEPAEIRDLRLDLGDGAPLVIDRIALAAETQGDQVQLRHLQVNAFQAELAAQGRIGLGPRLPLQLDLDWRYQPPQGAALAGKGSIQGDLARLTLNQTVAAPLAGQLEATLTEPMDALGWEVRLKLDKGELGKLVPDFPATLTGDLQGKGGLKEASLEGELTLEQGDLGRLKARFGAGFDGQILTAQRLRLDLPGQGRLEAKGHWRLADGTLEADLNWAELRWPLQGEPVQASSPKGQLNLKGQLTDYRYQLSGELRVPQAPPLSLAAKGQGDLTRLALERLRLDLPEGGLDASGHLGWSPEISWELKLKGDGLNPALALPELPGRLALAADTQGRLAKDGPQGHLRLERLEGKLRDYPLQASGGVDFQGTRLTLDTISLRSGKSHLEASGGLGEKADLAWRLDAQDLASLWPGLAGRLQAQGRLRGPLTGPRVEAKLQGGGIAYQGNQVGQLQGSLDLDLSQEGPFKLDLAATDLVAGELGWSRFSLGADGRRAAHALRLNLDGKEAPSLKLALSGALDLAKGWQGRIGELELNLPQAGAWRLERPAALALGAERVLVEGACLATRPNGRLCLSAKGDPARNWQAALQVERLSSELLKPWLPPDLNLTAQAGAQLDLRGAGGRVTGTALVELPEGRLKLDLGGEVRELNFSGSRLQAQLDGKGASAEVRVPLAQVGEITGEARLPGLSLTGLDPKRQRLQGRLRARMADLALFAGLTPAITDLKGRVEADFQMTGALAAPQLQGQASLLDGALDVPQLGLQIRQARARIQATDLDRLRYEASARSGEGTLRLDGETRLRPAEGFPTELRIKGTSWVVANIPEASAQIAPDLTLRYQAGETQLTGTLTIPQARLQPRQLPQSATKNSADLELVRGNQPATAQAGMRLKARLRLVLGDRVSFTGFGLRGRFAGNLEVIDEPGRPVLGNGSLSILEGTYKAYGQDLTIEKGTALFAESPVDNPGLDVRAVRKTDDVTAGLRVTGSLQKPQLTLFSKPSMTQTSILSYILTGKAPTKGSGGLGSSATSALAAGGASSLATELGRQLGMDELSMETDGNLQGASVMAGTWLSPRLYVQYVTALGARDAKLRLRYNLTERIQIQTESGSAQGMDLYYTIER